MIENQKRFEQFYIDTLRPELNDYLGKSKKYFSVTFLCIFYWNTGFSYDHDRCEKGVEKYKTFIFMDVFSSTSQFVSSTGACRMIGMTEHGKKLFLVQNFESMKIDSARGAGEYIEAYASISMCNKDASNELSKAFQKNFVRIYGESVEREPEQVYGAMEAIMNYNPILQHGCSHETKI